MASRESDREAGGLHFEGWRQRFVDARGLRFSAVVWGEARRPALVLLHGLVVEAHCWDPFANALQDEFQLIAFDLRGHGDSDWPQPPSYETQDFVDDLAALAGRWPLERFSLVGHSSGAAAAFAFALSHPDMVERLVVLDPAPLGGADGAPAWAALPAYDSFEAMVEAMAQVYPRSRPEWVRHWAAHNGRRLAGRKLDPQTQPGRPGAAPRAALGPRQSHSLPDVNRAGAS